MNKRGQVFLMAALIVTGVMFSLVKISNKGTAREEPEAFYDLSSEIDFEVKKVLDYGVINGVIPDERENYARYLINNYSEYISKEDVVFIYGEYGASNIRVIFYDRINTNDAISLGYATQPVRINKGTFVPVTYNFAGDIIINVNNIDYTFTLKPGQNFYFVLIKEEDGEKYVTIK